jgi:hypothetical protein
MTPLHLIFFLFIGHSNMTGYCAAMDTVPSPRVWSYSPAKGFYNCTDRDLESGSGSPMMPFLKRMALMYPGYNFCGIRFAGPCRQAFHVYTEQRHREAIANIVKQIKDKGSFGGALLMFGIIENKWNGVDSLQKNLIELVSFLRATTDDKVFPVILGRFEENGDHVKGSDMFTNYKKTVGVINHMPQLIENLSLTPRQPVPVDGFCDNHHYNAEGYRIWANDAASIYKYNGYDSWSRK